MMRWMREFRIIPVVLFAAVCLLALKVIGIVRGSGYVLMDGPFLGETLTTRIADSREAKPVSSPETRPVQTIEAAKPPQAAAAKFLAQEYPDVTGSVPENKWAIPQHHSITGSVPEPKPTIPQPQIATKKSQEPPKEPPVEPTTGTRVNLDASRPSSPAERAILERLQERRQEIEARAREMDIRDGLLKAAEMRLEARLAELKAMEARVTAATEAKDNVDASRFKGLVSMYENMKPKDAAKIFDRLELPVLVQVTTLINPRKMSDILGLMSAEAAERLTVELAARASGDDKGTNTADLPKIQGRPGG
jgi:flagellar motility protein MotE (MotC chaperone)